MINIDASVIIQIINFIFLIWVLNIVLYKPIRKVLRQRREKVNGLEQGIDSYNKDAKEKDESFEQGIKAARRRGFREKEDILQKASDQERRIIANINEKAQSELAAIREKIHADAEIARTSLQQEIETFADAIENRILGGAV